jgi:rhamnosyltransferase
MKNRILLYVHFNKLNQVSEHVKYQLREMKDLYSKVVFISNSQISDEDKKSIEGLYDEFLRRENSGFDFAAWRDGINLVGWKELEKFDNVTLMNDTCFGPIYSMNEIYDEMEQHEGIDFWGITDHDKTMIGMPGTNAPTPKHIQSYFTCSET